MKKVSSALFIAATTLLFAGQSNADTVNDNYIGGYLWHGVAYAQSDVIGGDPDYNITKVVTTQTDDQMTVDIYTAYVNHVGGYDTTLGDLWLSTNGWSTTNSKDTYLNGEQWEYSLVIDDHNNDGIDDYDGTTNVGDILLFAVSGSTDYVLSENAGSDFYRAGQEVLYNVTDAASGILAGTWTLTNDAISYSFDLSLLSNLGDELGFRWAMTCANDIIEGKVSVDPVPEPATMLLFGAGLAGVAGFQARRKKNA